ncbi:Ig-like V-type domain-containing protein FAM187A [Pelobates fuscus]|uniref:Ig-like V-type domain-containing protein FAM187A n=1 Tax=Pelobates fuscus TaxID=191477 RepID=UPI002FE466B7
MRLNAHANIFLLFDAFLLYMFPAGSFEIAEKEDIFRVVPCPAFIIFDIAAFLEGMTIELPCHCKPEQIDSVVWYYQKEIGDKSTRVLTDFGGTIVTDSENIHSGIDLLLRFSIRMFSLIVFQSQPEDSGYYICGSREGQYFYGYNVDIQKVTGILVAFEDQQGHPQGNLVMKDFKVFTLFWDWTICDRCNVRGEQRRVGLCYIQSKYLYPRYRITEENVAACGSGAVDSRFKMYLADRKPELAIRSCDAPCYVRKKGFMGALQHMWHLTATVTKFLLRLGKVPLQVHLHALGSSLALACPGAKPHFAVAWDKGKNRMYLAKYLLGNNASMRIFIDFGNHLNIHYVQRNDEATYTCWLQGRRKARFRLVVETDLNRNRKLTDVESIFAMKVIGYSILCFTIIFILANCLKVCSYNFRIIPFLN